MLFATRKDELDTVMRTVEVNVTTECLALRSLRFKRPREFSIVLFMLYRHVINKETFFDYTPFGNTFYY